jgi:lysozyme
MNMQLSEKGGIFIRKWEDYAAKPYQDLGGVWTWGFGHARVGHEPMPTIISPLDALALWKRDMAPFVAMANKAITHPMSQNQFDMFISILENVGPGVPKIKDGVILLKNGKKSTLLTRINEGAFDLAAAEFPKWDKVGAHEVRGLLNRRNAEKAIFQTADGV